MPVHVQTSQLTRADQPIDISSDTYLCTHSKYMHMYMYIHVTHKHILEIVINTV